MSFSSRIWLCFTIFGFTAIGFVSSGYCESPQGWSQYADRTLSSQERQQEIQRRQIKWPEPVRLSAVEQAQYESSLPGDEMQPSSMHPASSMGHDTDGLFYGDPAAEVFGQIPPAHAVLRSPELQKRSRHPASNSVQVDPGSSTYSVHHGHAGDEPSKRAGLGAKLGSHLSGDQHQQTLPAPPIHGKHSKMGKHSIVPKHFSPVEARPAMIAGAREKEVWKQPYSYGHFGASRSRHWSKQHGYRDRYTEWRFK